MRPALESSTAVMGDGSRCGFLGMSATASRVGEARLAWAGTAMAGGLGVGSSAGGAMI